MPPQNIQTLFKHCVACKYLKICSRRYSHPGRIFEAQIIKLIGCLATTREEEEEKEDEGEEEEDGRMKWGEGCNVGVS